MHYILSKVILASLGFMLVADLWHLTGMLGEKDVLNASRVEGKSLSKPVVYENGANIWSEPALLGL